MYQRCALVLAVVAAALFVTASAVEVNIDMLNGNTIEIPVNIDDTVSTGGGHHKHHKHHKKDKSSSLLRDLFEGAVSTFEDYIFQDQEDVQDEVSEKGGEKKKLCKEAKEWCMKDKKVCGEALKKCPAIEKCKITKKKCEGAIEKCKGRKGLDEKACKAAKEVCGEAKKECEGIPKKCPFIMKPCGEAKGKCAAAWKICTKRNGTDHHHHKHFPHPHKGHHKGHHDRPHGEKDLFFEGIPTFEESEEVSKKHGNGEKCKEAKEFCEKERRECEGAIKGCGEKFPVFAKCVKAKEECEGAMKRCKENPKGCMRAKEICVAAKKDCEGVTKRFIAEKCPKVMTECPKAEGVCEEARKICGKKGFMDYLMDIVPETQGAPRRAGPGTPLVLPNNVA